MLREPGGPVTVKGVPASSATTVSGTGGTRVTGLPFITLAPLASGKPLIVQTFSANFVYGLTIEAGRLAYFMKVAPPKSFLVDVIAPVLAFTARPKPRPRLIDPNVIPVCVD